jgi:predicted transcriptional regulator
MKLLQYIDDRGLAVADFADAIQVTPQTVYRYLSGERTPRGKMMRRIIQATKGAVQPVDFLEQDAA